MGRILFYAVWLGMATVMFSSCGGSKKSSSIRKIEKHAKRNPVDDRGNPVAARGSESKQVRQAMEKQQKQKEATAKEDQKAYKDAITRHRTIQTQETRDRMDRNLKETEKRHRTDKEFFLVRWFKPKDSIEKIEKRRAREVQKRMAANLKKAEKTNTEYRVSSFKPAKRESKKPPDPKDVVHGGGGNYNAGSKGRVNPSDIQHGGGGSYKESRATAGVNPSNVQHGGGGSYVASKPKSTFFQKLFPRKNKSKKR
jgi:hypothetical protein